MLAPMMPPGVPPIALFRTFARNPAMTLAMQGWGSYELSRDLSLTMRQREIVIDRTCARCGCEYEWGVHVAFFADRVGFSEEQVRSLTHGTSADDCWTDPRNARSSTPSMPSTTTPTSTTTCGHGCAPDSTRHRSSTSCCSPAGTTPSASWPAASACRSSRARPVSPTRDARSVEPMARLDVTDDQIHVRFTPTEKVLGFVRDHSFPRDAVEGVELIEDGLAAARGIRAPGLGIPRIRLVGTWRHRGGKDLVSVRRDQPALRVTLRNQRYAAVLIGLDDARNVVDRLQPAG